jgi:hypothetical protein
MRLHREATDRRSARRPGTGAAQALQPIPRQRPAGQRRPATRPSRQCDECSHRNRRQPGPSRRSGRLARAAPPFGLTLRAMIVGKRHRRGPSSARPVLLLMSVISLLALACFPVLAQAECVSSSCVQYTDAIPKAEGANPPAHHPQTPAKSSSTDKNGGAPAPDGATGPSNSMDSNAGSSEDGSSKGGAAAVTKDGGGTGQGSPGGSANGAGKAPVQHSGQVASKPASQSSDSGSSPLLPILIAILALAAISVGAVMFRQRRQRRGPTTAATPKAS